MKTQSTFLAQLNKNEIKVLTTQVEETLATVTEKKFTSADLWKIQKQKRVFVTRRSFAA